MASVMRGAIYFIVIQFFALVSSLIIHAYLARILGPNQYGVLAVIISFIAISNTLLTSGTPKAASRYIAMNSTSDTSNKLTTFYICKRFTKLQIIFTIPIFIFTLLLSKFLVVYLFGSESYLIPFIIAVTIIPIESMYILFYNFLNGLKKYSLQGNTRIVYYLAKTIGTISLVYIGLSIVGAIAGFALGSSMALLLTIYYFFKVFKHANGDYTVADSITYNIPTKEILSYSFPLIVYSFLEMTLINSDLFLLQVVLSNSYYVGIYAAVKNIAKVPYLILSAISIAIFPAVASISNSFNSSHSNDDVENVQSGIHEGSLIIFSKKVMRYLIIITVPIAMVTPLISRDVILLLFTSLYLQGEYALIYLTIAFLIYTIASIVLTKIIAMGYSFFSVIYIVSSLILLIFLSNVLIPILGINGVAIAWIITSVYALIVALLKFYHVTKKNIIPLSTLYKCILSGIISFFATYTISKVIINYMNYAQYSFILSAIYLGLFISLYFPLLYLFKELKKEDILLLISAIKH